MLWVVADRFSGTGLSAALSSCLEDYGSRARPPFSLSDSAGSLNPHCLLCFRVSSAVSETDISSSLPFNLAGKGELWSCCVDSS